MDHEFFRTVRRLKRELYGEYGGYYYVPMAEAYAVQLPVTVGCSHNRCLYCDLNQGLSFREMPFEEITANIRRLSVIHSRDARPVSRVLLAGGNPFVLPAEKLLRVAEAVRAAFPQCVYISCFSRADDVLRKPGSELAALRQAGFDRLCLGIESGSDRVLRYHNKGVGRAENAAAMAALHAAGMRCSAYIMLGLGGREMSDEHVEETASLVNGAGEAAPFELTVVTLVLFKGAGLVERVRRREFKRMPALETLAEGRRLLSLLTVPTVWDATHKTNAVPLKGRLPEHRELLIRRMDEAIGRLSGMDMKSYEIQRWQRWGTE